MRKLQTLLLGLLLGPGAVIVGCGGIDPEAAPVGTSQARLVMAVQGSASASLHVTATCDTSAGIAIDQTVAVDAGGAAVLDVALEPSTYTVRVEVLDSASGAHLGDGSAEAVLVDGETTEIKLTAKVDGTSGDTTATVQVGVDTAPRIDDVTVQLDGSADAKIHVAATDVDGDALAFFWSGAGMEGAVQGSATLSIPVAAVTAVDGPAVVHVIVQDPSGATAAADVTLAVAGDGVQVTVDAGAAADGQAAQACLEAQAACNATCQVSIGVGGPIADASCLAGCSLALASCAAP